MNFTYCPHCGTKLIPKEIGDEGIVPYCETCRLPLFPMFASCVIVLVTNERDEIALLRQGYISHQYHNLVSGYIKPGETAEETARREVEEEIGIRLQDLEFAGTWWFGKKDMLMIGFVARAKAASLHLSGEVDGASWVPAEEALGKVHPEGSVSHALVSYYLQNKRV